jgi:hypothetical protein
MYIQTYTNYFAACRAFIERQQGLYWCWVSVIQYLLSQSCINLTQRQIATRLMGSAITDRPGHYLEILNLIQSYGFAAWQVPHPYTEDELRTALHSGFKVIAQVVPNGGTVGHLIVLDGILRDGSIVVADPGTGSVQSYTICDLYCRWKWTSSIVVR